MCTAAVAGAIRGRRPRADGPPAGAGRGDGVADRQHPHRRRVRRLAGRRGGCRLRLHRRPVRLCGESCTWPAGRLRATGWATWRSWSPGPPRSVPPSRSSSSPATTSPRACDPTGRRRRRTRRWPTTSGTRRRSSRRCWVRGCGRYSPSPRRWTTPRWSPRSTPSGDRWRASTPVSASSTPVRRSRAPTGRSPQLLPCESWEHAAQGCWEGQVIVRAPDGTHFCPDEAHTVNGVVGVCDVPSPGRGALRPGDGRGARADSAHG